MKTGRHNLDQVRAVLGTGLDVIICSASFEERCVSIPLRIDPGLVKRAIILISGRADSRVKENLERLRAHFGAKAEQTVCSPDDPIATFDVMNRVIMECVDGGQDICVDMSTFTHEWVLMMYRVVRKRQGSRTVRFVYTRAKEYAVGVPVAEKWLSRGIREVRSVVGYPGSLMPTRPVHLIVLVGLEFERALGLIDAYEPHKISLGRADDGDQDARAHQEAHVWHVSRVKDALGEADEFPFPPYNPEGTADAIERLFPDETQSPLSTIIAPMNTKLSTLAAAEVAARRKTVQVCYAQPVTYNYDGYSIPGTEFFVVEIRP